MDNLEKEVIRKLKLGNEESFHFIFKKHYLPLYYYAKKITGNKENAEEVLQNTFLRLWENPEALNIDISLESYLFKSVYNNSINLIKQLQIKTKYENNYRQWIIEADEIYAPSEKNSLSVLMTNELNEKIEISINKLPRQCQKIFKLSRYEGLKNKEIAAQLDISLNTVIKQISIALAKLRKSLSQYRDNFP